MQTSRNQRQGAVLQGRYPWLRGPLGYMVCYLLYVLLIALGTAGILVVWRETLLLVLAVFWPESEWNRIIYLLMVFAMGIGLLIFVLSAEYYLRAGVPRGQLLSRFARLAVPLVGVSALGFGLQLWMLSLL